MVNIDDILNISSAEEFEATALEIFYFQAEHCEVYKRYLQLMGIDPRGVKSVGEIPFLPIELFKTHKVYCCETEPQMVFHSSNTGGTDASKHHMASLEIYKKAFTSGFTLAYGSPSEVSIYALLPNYMQQGSSSLVYMVKELIDQNKEQKGGFYLDQYSTLLSDMVSDDSPKILLGVSYALWDLAERLPSKLSGVTIMETGGMKGRREEISKAEFHSILKGAFGVDAIHSEYGMAELSSQAYSSGDGAFFPPPWMSVVLRDLNDPLENKGVTRGGINIIDLANIYSCAFIQSQDVGVLYEDGGFSIEGRIARSDVRGCNLLIAKD